MPQNPAQFKRNTSILVINQFSPDIGKLSSRVSRPTSRSFSQSAQTGLLNMKWARVFQNRRQQPEMWRHAHSTARYALG